MISARRRGETGPIARRRALGKQDEDCHECRNRPEERRADNVEWEVGTASGLPLSRLFQDFDWADEVLHAQLGREWYVKELGDLRQALEYGDRCWSRILSN